MDVVMKSSKPVGVGRVTKRYATSGIASSVKYDFAFWFVNQPGVYAPVNVVPSRRHIDNDMEIAEAAPVGWPAFLSVEGEEVYIALADGGERWAWEDCDE